MSGRVIPDKSRPAGNVPFENRRAKAKASRILLKGQSQGAIQIRRLILGGGHARENMTSSRSPCRRRRNGAIRRVGGSRDNVSLGIDPDAALAG